MAFRDRLQGAIREVVVARFARDDPERFRALPQAIESALDQTPVNHGTRARRTTS